MNMVAPRRNKEKRERVNFDGKTCWIGVDVHKVNYAVAILDEDGQMSKWSSKLFILKLYLLTFFEYLCNFKTLQRNNQHQWNSQFLS